ncbi:MAG TPA: DUF883 domain-containing protein [Paucimonas sp.]|nr:DUF883 domain-containing protein [Paucimonas sp.]
MSSTYPPGSTETRAGMNGQGSQPAGMSQDEIRRSARHGVRNLREDLNLLKSDLDALLSRASSLSETELKDAYGQMMSKFSTLRHAAKGIATQAGQQFNQGVDVTTEYVKERPLQAVGIAAGVGLVLGLLLGRR